MSKKKILLVDDDNRLRALLSLTIGAHYDFVQAADGQEGLAVSRAEKPDLILLDVAMPGMDGFEFLGHKRGEAGIQEIPVLMLTGRDSPDEVRRARELGAQDYFTKPFSPKQLLNKITEMLE